MRLVRGLIGALLLLALILGALGVFAVQRSFPQVEGEVEVAGMSDTVEVVRDGWGIPHIHATSSADLFRAQGYVHAQERFWQMDFWRHIGRGRLAEMFGESQVEADVFLRSLGFGRLAEAEWTDIPAHEREVLSSYADGVNAYLDERQGGALSLEYSILGLQSPGYEPEPWHPTDTLVWGKVMSWDLSGNMRAEIDRALLSASLPTDRVEQLYPPYPADHPVILGEAGSPAATAVVAGGAGALAALEGASARLEALERVAGGFEGVGSNNWAISGELTASGAPLLANDPHLGIQMPSIWFANGLHCREVSPDCPYRVVGFSFAGSPGVILGHNEEIAWGVTNASVDTQDVFIERVDPDDPSRYESDGDWVPFERRTETIEVAGGESLEVEVLSTGHGPVISGTFVEEGALAGSRLDLPDVYAVSLAWQTLEPSTLAQAILGINRARNHSEFTEAASLWDIAPQNLVFASRSGDIAYQLTGEIPVRAGSGRYPVPGWDGELDWQGTVPFDDLPAALNPEEGYVATANQPVVEGGGGLGSDAAYGYRAARIEELIEALTPHSIDTAKAIQLDTADGGARHLVPHLLAVDPAGDPAISELQEVISGWATAGLLAEGDSPGAAAYQAAWRHVLAGTFHDELDEEFWPEGGSRWFEVVRRLLDSPDDPWWDDVSTPAVEDRDVILRRALSAARDELDEKLGADPSGWDWGSLHVANFRNQSLGQSGIAPVEWLFNRTAPRILGGGSSIVNAIGWDANVSYAVDWVPSMRMIVDLGDHSASVLVNSTGQSGHAFHSHYADMLELWAEGSYVPMGWERDEIGSQANTLLLVPRRP